MINISLFHLLRRGESTKIIRYRKKHIMNFKVCQVLFRNGVVTQNCTDDVASDSPG